MEKGALLTDSQIKEYFLEKKLASQILAVEELKGGILNEVYLVKSDRGDFVYKKHLPRSKVFPDLVLPSGRYENEKNAYALLENILENQITPKMFLADDEQKILVIEYLGNENRVDKVIDTISSEIFYSIGQTLAEISNKTFKREDLLKLFNNVAFQELKYNLRYYKLIASESKLFPLRDKIMKEMRGNRVAFMHGDPRFNNMIIKDGRFYFIDFEGAYCADLPLDITYLLSEIFIYYYNTPTAKFREMATGLWNGYINTLSLSIDMDHLEYKIIKHLGFALCVKYPFL